MKFHKTSGNQAASQKQSPSHGNVSELAQPHGHVTPSGPHQLQFTYIESPLVPIEPLVTKKTLCEHYQMALRTLDYAIALGLPVVPVGRNIRFKLSQVQPWFEKNGYRRIAAEGRKLAIEKALRKSKQFQFALESDVQITTDKAKTKPKKKSV